jgi:hypothetical protein
MSNPSLASPPPTQTYALLSFPSPDILLVTFNRPESLNCVNVASSWELDALFTWFDNEPSLCVAIVTGSGRAFCAGADLKGRFIIYFLESLIFKRGHPHTYALLGIDCKDPNLISSQRLLLTKFCSDIEWNKSNQSGARREMPSSGFGALSRRTGKKVSR